MTSILRRGWLHLASGAGIGRILGFGSNLLLSRWLGPTDLGIFNLVTTTVQTGDSLVRCGADYALNYELGADQEAINSKAGVELSRALAQICTSATLLLCLGLGVWILLGQGLFPAAIAGSQRLVWSLLLLVMLACEGISASAWEVLLVSHQTSALALRQGLFIPLRLLLAALGALMLGVSGALAGWCVAAVLQFGWLKHQLASTWMPLRMWPLLLLKAQLLLRRGFHFYCSNLLASLIFYPLLLKVASVSGLADLGYLRVGQVMQQMFAFLPATFVPVLFLKLRSQPTFEAKVAFLELPLRIFWMILLELLLLYCLFDHWLVGWFFGRSFEVSLLPTRLLLLTALLEGVAQLVVQPLLASGQSRLYGLVQNISAILSALVGWLWIPSLGLPAYLLVRLLYVLVPLILFGMASFGNMSSVNKLYPPILVTSILTIQFSLQILGSHQGTWLSYPIYLIAILYVAAAGAKGFSSVKSVFF